MTRTVETKSKATIRKIAETESISEPSRFSEKPVSVTKAVPKKNVSNKKMIMTSVKRTVETPNL